MIWKIRCEDGSWAETEHEITQTAVNCFKDLFTQPPPQVDCGISELNVKGLSPTVIKELSEPYIAEEITAALYDFHPSKALGLMASQQSSTKYFGYKSRQIF